VHSTEFSSVTVFVFNHIAPKGGAAHDNVPARKNPMTRFIGIAMGFIQSFKRMNAATMRMWIPLDGEMRKPRVPQKKDAMEQATVCCPHPWSDYLTGSKSGEGDGTGVRRSGSGGATGSSGVSRIG
jgi:hypothetical protein